MEVIIENKSGKTGRKGINMMEMFDKGLSEQKKRIVSMRKDTLLQIKLKNKYDFLSAKKLKKLHENNPKYNRRDSIYILKNGKNLFELEENELMRLEYIYELKLNEMNVNFNLLSSLPNLTKLDSNFSALNFNPFSNNKNYFKCLFYLDLSFCNLNNTIFQSITPIEQLKSLVLKGNQITNEIPDLSNLNCLEHFDLSYNKISSQYVNLNSMKFNNSLDSDFKTKFIESINENNFANSKEIFNELKNILQTNLNKFYHNISHLKNLVNLNLSHNSIHFFDIDPFVLQEENGFSQLKNLDLSSNKFEEEISVILLMNINQLETIDLSRNPISYNKQSFENIEYEIFKNKNFLLINDNGKMQEKTFFKFRTESVLNANKISERIRKQVEEPFVNQNQRELLDDIRIESDNLVSIKPINSDLFLTNTKTENANLKENKHSKFKCKNYFDFLKLANKCFGKERHYTQALPITKSYKLLKSLITKPKSDTVEYNASYLKPLSRSINLNSINI